jgi:hypothetical protein
VSGHVFVVRGDLTHLSCDDWLIPSDRELTLTEAWLTTLREDAIRRGEDGIPRLAIEAPHGYRRGDTRVTEVPADVRAETVDGSPATRGRAWVLDVGSGDEDVTADWLVAGVRRWLDTTHRDGGRSDRSKPLVALPLVGTGAGGKAARHDEVLRELLPALQEHADDADVDIALVLNDPRDHAAAQQVRRAVGLDWDLEPALLDAADGIAAKAGAGRLALFLGAGVSRTAGLPLWDDLIAELLDLAGVDDRDRDAARRLDVQDQAEYVARRLSGGEEELAEWVRRRFAARPHGLAHSLLAALPVREAVTTNWDPLFEQAAGDAGRRLAVLPYDDPEGADAWLLKLHGDAVRGGEIVVRREDYLRFGADQSALAGVVQALLFTRHMLFVGFSLVDDNFIRIADGVTRLVDRYTGRRHDHADPRRLGTTVALRSDPAKQALWPHLDHLAVADEQLDTPERARRLEMFLDALGARVEDGPAYLLDERYAGLLDDCERSLAQQLAPVVAAAADHRECTSWARIRALLDTLGAPPDVTSENP